jgi:hypothetical protein
MEKNSIVQFVCFVTDLEEESFVSAWSPFATELIEAPANVTLQQLVKTNHSDKFKYISQHACNPSDFKYSFMRGRSKEYLPDHRARIIQIGGYAAVQVQCMHNDTAGDVKVMAFLNVAEQDLGFYHRLTYRHLNIFEAYFESCTYSHIMEFFIQEQEAASLVKQIRSKPGSDAAQYNECISFRSGKKQLGPLL